MGGEWRQSYPDAPSFRGCKKFISRIASNEIEITITDTADMVGLTSVVTPSHIIFGKVAVRAPEMKIAISTSSKDAIKARNPPARMALRSSGNWM